jgi:hypothetical protein
MRRKTPAKLKPDQGDDGTENLPTELSAEELCSWTGLTDRRHRQLASAGYFPPPVGGVYQFGKTVSGMIRYYQEQADKAKGGIMELRQANLEKQNLRLDIEIARIEGELIEKREVRETFMRIELLMKAIFFAALEQELPARAVGKTAEEIRLIARDIGDRVCECFQNGDDQWHEKH